MADVFDKCRVWETHKIFKSAGLYPFAWPVDTLYSAGEASRLEIGPTTTVVQYDD